MSFYRSVFACNVSLYSRLVMQHHWHWREETYKAFTYVRKALIAVCYSWDLSASLLRKGSYGDCRRVLFEERDQLQDKRRNCHLLRCDRGLQSAVCSNHLWALTSRQLVTNLQTLCFRPFRCCCWWTQAFELKKLWRRALKRLAGDFWQLRARLTSMQSTSSFAWFKVQSVVVATPHAAPLMCLHRYLFKLTQVYLLLSQVLWAPVRLSY